MNLWMTTNKTFTNKSEPCFAPMQNQRLRGCTVMGALDIKSHHAYYNTCERTDNVSVKAFFVKFFTSLRNSPNPKFRALQKVVVILDNLNSHKNPQFKEYVRSKGVLLDYSPRYSSSMNAIEHAWSSLKTAWRRFLVR